MIIIRFKIIKNIKINNIVGNPVGTRNCPATVKRIEFLQPFHKGKIR